MCGTFSVPHHVVPWEQYRNGVEPMKQIFKIRSLVKDSIMDPKLRIVQCPKCQVYLQEPPVGNPFYQCGNCFATLQAIHATQEDVDRRLQQKALCKRLEIDKSTKSASSEDGYKVFTSESSSEKSIEREEQANSREGSPSWSPSRRESPRHGHKPGYSQPQPQLQSHQQKKPAELSEKLQYQSSGEAARAKQEVPQEKVDVLSQNLHRLSVEDNDELQHHNRVNPEWANGHGAHHLSMRRSRLEESHQESDGESHHPQGQNMHKSASFNDILIRHSGGPDRSPSYLEDVKVNPSETEGTTEDSIHHILDDFLSARYDARPQYSKADGYEIQRDMLIASDVADYGTSSRTSSIGDGDAHNAAVVENQLRPPTGEPDSYVHLDHRVTRPGSYQRSSSASRPSQKNAAYHHSADNHEKYHSDGEKSSPRTYSASNMQPRSTSFHVPQPSNMPHQPVGQSLSHHVYNKPPAGQSHHVSHETIQQIGAPKSYPFLPRPDEPQVVHCQHCEQYLGIPANLPPAKKGYQKLRCGACQKISVFLAAVEEHFSSPTLSPKGHGPFTDFSTTHASHISSLPDAGHRLASHGAKSDFEIGDRGHPPIASGASQRLPPMSRNIPRIPSGSKLSAMTSAMSATAMMGHAAVSNGVSNLHPATGAGPARVNSSPHYGDGKPYRRSQSAYGPNGEHVMSSFGPRASPGSDYSQSAYGPNGEHVMSSFGPRASPGSDYSQSAYGPNGEHVMSSFGPRASSGSDYEGRSQSAYGPNGEHVMSSFGPRASPGSDYSQSAYGPNGEHIMSSFGPRASPGSDYEGYHPHDGRHFQTSSESDNDSPRTRPSMSMFKSEQFHASSRMPLDRHVAQQYSKDEGFMQEANVTSSMSMKGIMRKNAKEPTKLRQDSNSNLYRRKVSVNGTPIPDALLKRAEGLAGPIHPGSYWYDSQAGFWGLSGGPCLGIIPPHIEELSIQPLSRNCSGGQTGVVVNGRELHKSDYDLLVRRGLPPTSGKTYFVDIEGHVKEVLPGYELRGLGPLALPFDQTSRGQGMRVPGTSQVA